MIYVSMTDKFKSGWGDAKNKTDKYIIECDTFEQAEIAKDNAERRSEMKYINICLNKPRYKTEFYTTEFVKFDKLGSVWTQERR